MPRVLKAFNDVHFIQKFMHRESAIGKVEIRQSEIRDR